MIDWPEYTARVWEMKLQAILKDIVKKQAFGKVAGYVFTIEWQKRGLPHAHILLILAPEDKLKTPADVDRFISAQLPDDNDPLYDYVKRNMMHGPCGHHNPNAPCMRSGVCFRGFPKNFCEVTTLGEDGYPSYARPNNGRHVKVQGPHGEVTLDNRYVVPHSPWFGLKYGSHGNLEAVFGFASVKYVYKVRTCEEQRGRDPSLCVAPSDSPLFRSHSTCTRGATWSARSSSRTTAPEQRTAPPGRGNLPPSPPPLQPTRPPLPLPPRETRSPSS